jgi:general secretion pathway protein M
MIDAANKRLPRPALFLAFNAGVALFVILFVIAPVWTHFANRSDDISEAAAQLSHFQALARNTRALMTDTQQAGDPFLSGTEERVVSADLQAGLKAIATDAGVHLLGIRGLPGRRSQQLRMVAVNVELEGTLPAIRNVLLAIENQKQFLFVTAASLRSVADGEDGMIRAEFKVQGALRDGGSPAGSAEVISQ